MSESLDKEVDGQNENLKIKIPGFMQALVKCVMKIKEKNDCCAKKLLKGGRRLAGLILMNFQITDSTLIEGTNSLVSELIGWEGWFVLHCHITSTIKLAMAGTREWWHLFTPLLVY